MFHFLFDEDAHVPASGRVQGHGDGGRPGFPRQCARPVDGQGVAHLRQSQFPFVPIPGERGCGIGGGSAVLLGFELCTGVFSCIFSRSFSYLQFLPLAVSLAYYGLKNLRIYRKRLLLFQHTLRLSAYFYFLFL